MTKLVEYDKGVVTAEGIKALREWVTVATGDPWFKLTLMHACDIKDQEFLSEAYVVMQGSKRRKALKELISESADKLRIADMNLHKVFYDCVEAPEATDLIARLTAEIATMRAVHNELTAITQVPKKSVLANDPASLLGRELVAADNYCRQKSAERKLDVSRYYYKLIRQAELSRMLGSPMDVLIPEESLMALCVKHYEDKVALLASIKSGETMHYSDDKESTPLEAEGTNALVARLEAALSLEGV